MSRATIRAALAAWLAPPNVAGINTVYRAMPRIIPGQAFFPAIAAGTGMGCVAMINIVAEAEARKAIGGANSGWKRVDYVVEIQLFFRSNKPAALNSDGALEAMDAFDAIVNALKVRIRADRTANSSAVWQWGEAELSGRYGEMKETPQGLEQWAAIRTAVTEWIAT